MVHSVGEGTFYTSYGTELVIELTSVVGVDDRGATYPRFNIDRSPLEVRSSFFAANKAFTYTIGGYIVFHCLL